MKMCEPIWYVDIPNENQNIYRLDAVYKEELQYTPVT